MVTFSSLGKAVPTLVLMTLALAQPSLQNPTYTTPAAGLQTFTFTQPVYSTPAVGLTTQEVSTRVVTSVIPVETVKSGGDLASELQIIVKEIEKLLGSLIGVITITAEEILALLVTIIAQLLGLLKKHGGDKPYTNPLLIKGIIAELEKLVGLVGSLLLALLKLLRLGFFKKPQRGPLGGLLKELLKLLKDVTGLVSKLIPGLLISKTYDGDLVTLLGEILSLL